MNRDPGDILDRFSISFLKMERIAEDTSKQEHNWFTEGLDELIKRCPNYDWHQFANYLYKINGLIWDLEADMRKGQLDDDLEEVGKRAIEIRKLNSLRVGFKNIVNKLIGEGIQDIKQDHISQ